jgi:hypothetical protein
MTWLIVGGLLLIVFMGGLNAFERASVTTVKALLTWLGVLGGIAMIALLILTGRGVIALAAAVLFGLIAWQQWQPAPRRRRRPTASAGQGRFRPGAGPRGQAGTRTPGSGMTQAEAYQVLGLAPGATEADIRSAHHRMMRSAHPDAGGSDWMAARVNMARDVLLGRRRT